MRDSADVRERLVGQRRRVGRRCRPSVSRAMFAIRSAREPARRARSDDAMRVGVARGFEEAFAQVDQVALGLHSQARRRSAGGDGDAGERIARRARWT